MILAIPPLRGAVIGCGYFARFHGEAWRRMDGVSIVAACDPDLDRARAVSGDAFENAERMLESVPLDFVDIATRPESHAELVRLAAAHHVDAICQKPMAPDLDGARSIARMAAESGIRLMIHDNWRWQPWYRKTAELMQAGAIGHPIGYGFRTRQRDGAGPEPYERQPYFREMPHLLIYEVLVHHIDVARFLFGDIASIYAVARRRNSRIAGEDQALIAMRHKSGVDGWIDGHRYAGTFPDGPVMGEVWIDGEEGVLAIAPSGDLLHNGELVWKNDVTIGYRGDSVYATQAHFVHCLRSGSAFETSAEDYLGTFGAAEAAYTSINECRPVAP